DLVDFVTKEGRKAGKSASYFIKGDLKPCEANVTVKNLNGIGYVVPGIIRTNQILGDKVELNFRVTKPMENVKLVVKLNGEIIKEIKKPHLIPSEMESLLLDKTLLGDGELTVEVQ
ncbi:MAG: pyridine nucleotide-disulfide oxidoreductase, partial [Bacilli bacterium]